MTLSRRHVLKFFVGITAVGAISPLPALAQSGKRTLVTGIERDMACAVNLDSLKANCFKIGFPPHSFVPVPHDPNLVWGIEKWGTHAAEIDIREGTVLRRINCPEEWQFYGHKAFGPKTIFCLFPASILQTPRDACRIRLCHAETSRILYRYALCIARLPSAFRQHRPREQPRTSELHHKTNHTRSRASSRRAAWSSSIFP